MRIYRHIPVLTAIQGTKENDAKRVSIVLIHNYIYDRIDRKKKAIFTSKVQVLKPAMKKKERKIHQQEQ